MANSTCLPRSETWEILEHSRNEAVIDVLALTLQTESDELRRKCLQLLLKRSEPSARRAVLVNWDKLTQSDRQFIASEHRDYATAAREVFQTGKDSDKLVLFAALTDLNLAGVLPNLIEIVCQKKHALQEPAAKCLIQICDNWGQFARTGRDVPSVRSAMLQSLYDKVVDFASHKQAAILDAWLVLTNWDDSLQRGLISDPFNDGYRPVLQRIGQTTHPSALDLLAGYLWRPATPKSVQRIVAERTEPELAIAIARSLDNKSALFSIQKLRDMPPLACFANIEAELKSCSPEIRRRLWLMLAATSEDTSYSLNLAIRVSKSGTAEARATAADMIRVCRRVELEKLVFAMQKSTTVNGGSTFADALEQIALWVSSPSTVLQKAAREFFEEFTLSRLLDQIRRWPSPLCKAMARIVRLTESDLPKKLTVEMQSPAPKRRIAGIQATQLLDLSREVSEELLPLVDDSRLEVRVRVIDLLSALGHEALEETLPRLLNDASTDIQEAAARAIKRFNKRKTKFASNSIPTEE